VFFNDTDRYAAAWLRNLYPEATVDERSITDLVPSDLAGHRRVHLFAGIGGWEYALELTGWPDDLAVWTGSCPCQPFSGAGRDGGLLDARHLWPAFYRLIAECRPAIVVGEQVASRAGREWLAGVRHDLEDLGYAVGAADLCAASIGAPHIRQRLYWVADAAGECGRRVTQHGGEQGAPRLESLGLRADRNLDFWASGDGVEPGGLADALRRGDADTGQGATAETPSRVQGADEQRQRVRLDAWQPSYALFCLDGKARRTQPGLRPLAHGVPARASKLRAYGNAIVPQIAAAFLRAYRG
jgi:DNA (cytosine-5)-methyltransferase 1